MALKENIMEQIHFASEKLKNGRREKKNNNTTRADRGKKKQKEPMIHVASPP